MRSVRLSSATIDTRRHARILTVRIRATDDSGIATIDAGLSGSLRSSMAHARLVSGTTTNGTWLGRIRVPRWQGNSTAKLAIEVTDVVGRYRIFGSEGTQGDRSAGHGAHPQPPGFGRSRNDVAIGDPALTRPAYRRTRVTVTVRVTDRGSGVRRVSLSLYGPESGNGAGSIDATFKRVSGTKYDGIWKGTATLPACEAFPGKWHLIVSAADATNFDSLSKPDWLAVENHDVLRPTAAPALTWCAPPGR